MRNFLRKYLGIVDPIKEAIPFDHKQGIDETELNEKKKSSVRRGSYRCFV